MGCLCDIRVMTIELEITPELQARIDAIAARSSLSASEVIADALENGHSLEWQEQFLDKVKAGIEAADRGEFASRGDIEHVLNKYRPS
jgi:predicted transcriptional regulator